MKYLRGAALGLALGIALGVFALSLFAAIAPVREPAMLTLTLADLPPSVRAVLDEAHVRAERQGAGLRLYPLPAIAVETGGQVYTVLVRIEPPGQDVYYEPWAFAVDESGAVVEVR